MSITTTVEHAIDIEAPPATVFDLWTTTDGLEAWWARSATIDLRPGGAIRVDIDGEHVMVGEFVVVEPPHRIVFTFGWEHGDLPPGASRVDVAIQPTDTGSRVVLRHDGLPVEFVESHIRGWTHFVGERLPEAIGR